MKKNKIPALSMAAVNKTFRRMGAMYAKSFRLEEFHQKSSGDYYWGEDHVKCIKIHFDNAPNTEVPYGCLMIMSREAYAAITIDSHGFKSLICFGENGVRWGQMMYQEYKREAMNVNEVDVEAKEEGTSKASPEGDALPGRGEAADQRDSGVSGA